MQTEVVLKNNRPVHFKNAKAKPLFQIKGPQRDRTVNAETDPGLDPEPENEKALKDTHSMGATDEI